MKLAYMSESDRKATSWMWSLDKQGIRWRVGRGPKQKTYLIEVFNKNRDDIKVETVVPVSSDVHAAVDQARELLTDESISKFEAEQSVRKNEEWTVSEGPVGEPVRSPLGLEVKS